MFTGFGLGFDEEPILEGVPLADRFDGELSAECPCNTTGVVAPRDDARDEPEATAVVIEDGIDIYVNVVDEPW